jgi:hypothetical protein
MPKWTARQHENFAFRQSHVVHSCCSFRSPKLVSAHNIAQVSWALCPARCDTLHGYLPFARLRLNVRRDCRKALFVDLGVTAAMGRSVFRPTSARICPKSCLAAPFNIGLLLRTLSGWGKPRRAHAARSPTAWDDSAHNYFRKSGGTYLAASSFSDNSWIEENTRRGSLKPHTKAESFCGLLNFSVSRETHPVPALGIPSNSATKNDPSTFYSLEPLLLIPLLIPSGPRPVLAMKSGDRARRGAALFSWEPLSLIAFGSRDAIDRTPTISGKTSSSSSLQGDSEILAVRKTDASVLRLLLLSHASPGPNRPRSYQ